MPKPLLKKRKAPWHDGLVCHIESLTYDFVTRIARLQFPPRHCCDAAGAVETVKAIDPKVERIETFAGTVPDTVYLFNTGDSGTWSAIPPS